jgi:hypothetical protein
MALDGAAFSTVPDIVYYGRSVNDRSRCDIVVDVRGAVFAP